MKKSALVALLMAAAITLAACDQPPLPDQVGNEDEDCTGPRCEDVTDTK